jgi:hypothetical protein
MKKKAGPAVVLMDLFLALGVALYAQICIQSGRFTIVSHPLRLNAGFFALWVAAFLLFLFASGFSKQKEVDSPEARAESGHRRPVLALLPFGFFLLSPWLLRFYFGRDDLRVRLGLLAFFIITAVLLLELPRITRYLRSRGAGLDRAVTRFASLPLRRRLVFLFLATFLIYQAAALTLVFRGASFSGDEPYYLLSSHSLLKEGDINVADNYARQDYFYFYSKKDNPRLRLGIYGRYGRRGEDSIYPINLPGISVLMLPFYWLSQFFSGRWLTFILKTSLSPWAALFGLQIYLYAREVWGKERLALGLWALFSFSSPVLFYAVHLYPEVPVALFCFYIFRKVTGPATLSVFQLAVLGLLLGLFPWFGLKFNFFFWPLLLISVYYLIARHKVRFRAGVFIAPAVVSMALFYMFIHSLYGTLSPIAVYEGVLTPERAEAFKQTLLAIPLRARIDAFLDYFLDQRDGLLLYSPVYFFAFLGLVEIWRRRKRDFWCFLLIGLPFLANYSLFTHRQGASPQGRVLTPLAWMGAVAVGHFLVHNRQKIFSLLFAGAAAAGLAVAGILLAHPSFLYQPTTHEFISRPGELFVHLSNLHFFLPPLLPSFIKVDNTRYWPNYIWLAALAAFILAYALSRREKPLGRAVPVISIYSALTAAFFLWVLFPRTALFPVKTVQYSPRRALGFYTFSMGKGVIGKDSGDFYLHLERDYRFVFGSRTELDRLRLLFGSAKGEYDLDMSLFDLPLFEGKTANETRELMFEPAAAYRLKSLFLYEVNVRLTHRSAESMQLDPFLFQVIPARE